MESQKYIISKLEDAVKQIPTIKILYKYYGFEKDHVIKVLPLNEFKNNPEFHKLEDEILLDFISKYPYDALIFTSDDSIIDINEEPDKIMIGKEYHE